MHVLFDVDGTLLDSRDAIVAAYRHAFASVAGVDFPRTDQEVRDALAARLAENCQRVAPDHAEACAAAYTTFYAGLDADLVPAYPGIADVLSDLTDAGTRLGLVTNKSGDRIDLDLRRAGLGSVPWTAVVCAEDTPQRKPHPAPILLGLRRAGASPAHAAYVGDGPHDVLAARAAGVRCIAVDYGYYGAERLAEQQPDALVHDTAGVREQLRRWGC